jgi:hypothetical protein
VAGAIAGPFFIGALSELPIAEKIGERFDYKDKIDGIAVRIYGPRILRRPDPSTR